MFSIEINHQAQWAHLRSSASVAGNDVNRLYKRRLGQFPGESVLAAAIANEEDTQLVVRHCMRRIGGVAKGMDAVPPSTQPVGLELVDSFGRSQKIPACATQRVSGCACELHLDECCVGIGGNTLLVMCHRPYQSHDILTI